MIDSDFMQPLTDLAAGQWGMFTSQQARIAGVSRMTLSRLAARGRLFRQRFGVYSIPGAPTHQLDDARAEWLALNPAMTVSDRMGDPDPIVVSHETAALAWGIGDLTSSHIWFTSERRVESRQSHVRTRRASLPGRTFQWLEGLPVTSVRRTIEDLISSGRWEDDHLQNLTRDAMERRLLTSEDVGRSVPIKTLIPELAPPAGHQSVLARLKKAARSRGVPPDRLSGTFLRMIFAGALTMASEGASSVWVMKGGTSLYGRLENPRSSRDLDLFRSDAQSAMEAASDLRTLMDGARVGAYTFQVGEPHFRAAEAQGTASVTVAAYAGAAKAGGFNIDVSADVWLVAEPQLTLIDRGDDVPLEGYPSRIPVHLYPVENQVADKICAMYETHETGLSTRYRDLYDLAMLADQTPMNESLLALALAQQAHLRPRLGALPRSLTDPSPDWRAEFNRKMAGTDGTEPPFTDYDTALRKAAARYDHALQVAHAIEDPFEAKRPLGG
ncbi:MAG: hypothetical protein GX596_09045 [Propionibacterium sp.]|nr:hypothetical protein [Propionibacterium sp.]